MARMWVTEGCNAFCHYCVNARSRSNYSMDLPHFESLCKYFFKNGFDKIAIMGGEPTTHQSFAQIMSISQSYFKEVYLYTNALNLDALATFKPRASDLIVYNFNFSDQLVIDKFLLSSPGERILDVVINTKTDADYIIEEIMRVTNLAPDRIKCQLVLDNCANIFKHKQLLIEKLNCIYNSVIQCDPAIRISFESNLPLCFTYGESLPPFHENTICPNEAILIDGRYNACFCNIYPVKLINMFEGENLIPFSILRNYTRMFSSELRLRSLSKICKDCLMYGDQCNGKCFISQESISREDIVANTKLVWFSE